MQSTECLVQLTFNTGMQQFGNDYYVGAMTIISVSYTHLDVYKRQTTASARSITD